MAGLDKGAPYSKGCSRNSKESIFPPVRVEVASGMAETQWREEDAVLSYLSRHPASCDCRALVLSKTGNGVYYKRGLCLEGEGHVRFQRVVGASGWQSSMGL